MMCAESWLIFTNAAISFTDTQWFFITMCSTCAIDFIFTTQIAWSEQRESDTKIGHLGTSYFTHSLLQMIDMHCCAEPSSTDEFWYNSHLHCSKRKTEHCTERLFADNLQSGNGTGWWWRWPEQAYKVAWEGQPNWLEPPNYVQNGETRLPMSSNTEYTIWLYYCYATVISTSWPRPCSTSPVTHSAWLTGKGLNIISIVGAALSRNLPLWFLLSLQASHCNKLPVQYDATSRPSLHKLIRTHPVFSCTVDETTTPDIPRESLKHGWQYRSITPHQHITQ